MDRARDSVLRAESLQFFLRQRAGAAICLGSHEYHRALALTALELFEPEAHPVQRISDVGSIEQDQRQTSVIDKQRMDEAVIGLACEVPKNRFALSGVGAALAHLGEHPELLPVC